MKITVDCTPDEVRELCGAKQLEELPMKFASQIVESLTPEQAVNANTFFASWANMMNPANYVAKD